MKNAILLILSMVKDLIYNYGDMENFDRERLERIEEMLEEMLA